MSVSRFNFPFYQAFTASTGAVGAGWKLYFWQSGTTDTAQTTYSDASLATPNSNPVIADSNGRWADIFLQDALYAVELTDENDAQIAFADPVGNSVVTSIVSKETEIITVTSDGQTTLTLTGMSYTPGANMLLAFLNGVSIDFGIDIDELSSTSFNWLSSDPLTTGDKVKIIKNQQVTSSAPLADNCSFSPFGTGALARSVENKLREVVSVTDRGAKGDGTTIDTTAIQNVLSEYTGTVRFPPGTYLVSGLTCALSVRLVFDEGAVLKLPNATEAGLLTMTGVGYRIEGGKFDGNMANQSDPASRANMIAIVLGGSAFFVSKPEIYNVYSGAGLHITGTDYIIDSPFIHDMGTDRSNLLRSSDCIHTGSASGQGDRGIIRNPILKNFTDYGIAVDYSDLVQIDSPKVVFTAAYAYSGTAGLGGAIGAGRVTINNPQVFGANKLSTGLFPSFTAAPNNGKWTIRGGIVESIESNGLVLTDYADDRVDIQGTRFFNCDYTVAFVGTAHAVDHVIKNISSESPRTDHFAIDAATQPPVFNAIIYGIEGDNITNRGNLNTSPQFISATDWSGGGAQVTFSTLGADQYYGQSSVLKIVGNATDIAGQSVSQSVGQQGKMTANKYYTLVVILKLTGRTAGQVLIDLVGTGIDTAGITVSANTTGFQRFAVPFTVASVPSDLVLRIVPEASPNTGFEASIAYAGINDGLDTRDLV